MIDFGIFCIYMKCGKTTACEISCKPSIQALRVDMKMRQINRLRNEWDNKLTYNMNSNEKLLCSCYLEVLHDITFI